MIEILPTAIFFFVLTVIVLSVSFEKDIYVALVVVFLCKIALLTAVACGLISLPDTSDASGFHKSATTISLLGFASIIDKFEYSSADNYRVFLSLLYKIFGANYNLGAGVSIFFSSLANIIFVKIILSLGKHDYRKIIILAFLFFPSLILYSIQPLRESLIYFFFTACIYFILRYSKEGRINNLFFAFVLNCGATFFHEGFFISLIVVPIFYFFVHIRSYFFRAWCSLLCIFLFVSISNYAGINLGKLGGVIQIESLFEQVKNLSEVNNTGVAAYSTFVPYQYLNIETVGDLIWALPVKVALFLVSPLHVASFTGGNLLALLDSIIYFFIIFLLLNGFRNLNWKKNREVWFLLALLLPLVLAFSLGVGNFGTAIRHRAKFVGGMLVVLNLLLFKQKR